VKERAENGNEIRFYSSVISKKVNWLWEPYIPYGKITVVQGDPGEGKTTLALNIAALLSAGLPMPESRTLNNASNIIYQSSEDGAEDTLKPRLESAGADCSRIAFIDESSDCLTLCSPRIESSIHEIDAKLIVLDPLQAYIGDGGDMNRADGVRPMLKRLAAVAERTGCAIVIIGHMNKSGGTKGVYRGLGSIDITAAARSVLLVARVKTDPEIRVMAQIKNSLAREGDSMAFEIHENSLVRWIGKYDISADELLCSSALPEDSGRLSETAAQLRKLLQNNMLACTEVYAQLNEAGFSMRTIDRAKKMLNIKSIKRTDGWYWSLQEAPHEKG
jgi:RecA-family ATPase